MYPPLTPDEVQAQAYRTRWRARQAATLVRARRLLSNPAATQAWRRRWAPWLWPEWAVPVGDEDGQGDRTAINS